MYIFFLFNKIMSNTKIFLMSLSFRVTQVYKPVLPLSIFRNFMLFAVPFVKQSASCNSLLHHSTEITFFMAIISQPIQISIFNLAPVTVLVECMTSIRDLLST